VQASDFGDCHNLSELRRLDRPRVRGIFREGEVGSGVVVVREIASQDPAKRLLVGRELLAQGEVLESDVAVAAAEDREESEEVEQESDHRAAIVSGSEPRDQPLAVRSGFWRRTGIARGAGAPHGRVAIQ
jgi:hypothetical protein